MTAKEYTDTLKAEGVEALTVKELDARLESLGYERHGSPCIYMARIMSSPSEATPAGTTWPEKSYELRHKESRLSAFNTEAPKGANFKTLQKLRRETVTLGRGYTVSV